MIQAQHCINGASFFARYSNPSAQQYDRVSDSLPCWYATANIMTTDRVQGLSIGWYNQKCFGLGTSWHHRESVELSPLSQERGTSSKSPLCLQRIRIQTKIRKLINWERCLLGLKERAAIDERKLKRRYQQARALEFTRKLKANPTRAEQVLLQALTDAGYWFKFRRCFYSPDTLFTPDFQLALHHQKLIVELDGQYHETQQKYDAQRTAWLEKNRNCIVIRFTNDEVFHDLSNVLLKIAAFNPKRRGKC